MAGAHLPWGFARDDIPEVSERLAAQVVGLTQRLRTDPAVLKLSGVAEMLDWARARAAWVKSLDNLAAAGSDGALAEDHEGAERAKSL